MRADQQHLGCGDVQDGGKDISINGAKKLWVSHVDLVPKRFQIEG
jgi:hypothetical protein